MHLCNKTGNWLHDIDPQLFPAIITLRDLHTLQLRVHPSFSITDAELSALTCLENLHHLEITRMLVDPGLELQQAEVAEGLADVIGGGLHITEHQLPDLLMALNKLDCLHIDLYCDEIKVGYESATLIAHIMSNLRHFFINKFAMVSDEAEYSTWPDDDDWAFMIPDGAWLPTNLAYHPDLRSLTPRSLSHEAAKDVRNHKH
jgi:hypothetical protein